MAFHQTRADAIQEKVKSVSLTSTPLFTLLIQLFQIDTKGCMKVIRERKLRQLELLKADARRPQQASQNTDTSSGSSSHPGCQRSSQRGVPRSAVRRPVAVKSRGTSAAAAFESFAPALQGAPPAQGQRQKPKTVSELLREKRLRESQAKKALQRTVLVAPQVLVSGPVIIQQPRQQIIPSAQAGSKPAAAVCTMGQGQGAPAPVPASAAASGSTSAVVPENHSLAVPEPWQNPARSQGTELPSSKEVTEQALGSSPEGGGFPGVIPAAAEKAPGQGGCNGQVIASSSASVMLQNQAYVPHQITVVPVGLESGTSKLSLSTPVTCELNSHGAQQRPVNLLPALVTPRAGSVIPNSIPPFTWFVSPQALLPTAVQTVVGVPHGAPAAPGRSQCQTTVASTSNVFSLGVAPVPAGANPASPSSVETQGPSSQPAEGVPLGKAADHSTMLFPVTSVSPECTTFSIPSVTPACSNGFSKASVPPAALAARPDTPALCAMVLPLAQPPAGAPGADPQYVLSLSSLGKILDSFRTNGAPSNPDITTKRVVLQLGDPVPGNNVPGSLDGCAAPATRNRPIASKPAEPADTPPQRTTSSAEKNLLDFSLISLEDEGLVKEWLSGKQGVQVPSLQTRLPYLPPFLCNLKTLSKLLLQKAALEEQASCLLPSDAGQDGGTRDNFQAIGELVQQKLGDNPAYLLLKARFLAAFTLPAVLATLPPPKVTTTLSASRKQYEESDEEEWQSEKEVSEEESCGNELAGVRSDWGAGDEPGDKDADLFNQDESEEDTAQSALDSCSDVADASAAPVRRSARFRKRRRRM